MRKMRHKNYGFMLEIWLKFHHFLTQISASREYIHNNILLPQSSVSGLGGLVRARKENKAVKYLPIRCNKPKTKNLEGTQQQISYTYATFTLFSTSQISTRFHHLEIYPQPISVLNTLHLTYSFQSSLFYYPCFHLCCIFLPFLRFQASFAAVFGILSLVSSSFSNYDSPFIVCSGLRGYFIKQFVNLESEHTTH